MIRKIDLAGPDSVVIIGAGMAGLSAAVLLAARGVPVTVVERMGAPGGKLRTVDVGGVPVDAGPTVFTHRPVFERIFADAGTSLDAHLTLHKSDRLARHAWQDGTSLDLWADHARSFDAVAQFAGPREAEGWTRFQAESARIWNALETRFMESPAMGPVGLTLKYAPFHLHEMFAINPFATLWNTLGKYFRDPRLHQLYGRYATYTGADPFQATATLMLIAHLEARGVWLVEGGMHEVARQMALLAERLGAKFHYNAHVAEILVRGGRAAGVRLASGEELPAHDILSNSDISALADGRFGAAASGAVTGVKPHERSLSGLVTMMTAETSGFEMDRHNVFFSTDYAAEFRHIFGEHRLPAEPSIYICAQDRGIGKPPDGPERLQLIVNAPPTGDGSPPTPEEMEQCQTATLAVLARCGLTLKPTAMVPVGPAMFEALFPSSGGALYGRASHGWQASFRRPGSKTKLPGLWVASGSAHPGAGVPMAALSGRLASAAILQARASIRTLHPVATAGGMSTPKATADNMA
ncbi:1-hydroxycarotenoid 3,4-desaturase CrtD [Sandarakinorhabdus limnophila]|jgi:1-hydroxycarotenoid 3,4-desaturase|uniref:1-hydroxycarotenoid 3,4-desaturase CrtD n=1 Tax=Sandarakinorhabdus limnophila TaxID=210512 RepID=UPI0026F04183|nr:1-hydroxycarotenoid 3,4-desaturase CrtD [Sandarakinorhabdus limnophila]